MLFYIAFLILLIIATYNNRDTRAFRLKDSISKSLNVSNNFYKVIKPNQFWEWSRMSLVSFLYPDVSHKATLAAQREKLVSDLVSYRIGPIRFRQHRTRPGPCPVNDLMSNVITRCSPVWSSVDKDTENYSESWTTVGQNKTNNQTQGSMFETIPGISRQPLTHIRSAWIYRTWSDTGGLPVTGNLGLYPAGGYVLDIVGFNKNDTLSTLEYLQDKQWLDNRTRVVFVELTLYTPNVNLFARVTAVFEFPQAELVLGYMHIHSFRLFVYLGKYPVVRIACDYLIYAVTIWFVYREVWKLCRERTQYFKHFWNIIELANMLCSLCAVALHVGRHVISTQVSKDFVKDTGHVYNFQTLALMDEVFGFILAFVCFMAILQVLNLFRFNKRMSVLGATLMRSAADLWSFMLVLVIMLFAFLSFSYVTFSPFMRSYRTVVDAFESLLLMALGKMQYQDVALLEKLIQDDIAAAKTPMLIVAYAGTPIVGHVDNLQRLQEISKNNGIWLHVEGNSLATLTMFSVPTSIETATSGDSITLDLTSWLGVPSLSYITLFKESDRLLTESAGLTTADAKLQLRCLPLWMCLQSLGHEGIVAKIKFSCELAKTLFDYLDKITTVKQVSREKKRQEKEVKNVKDLISKAVSALLVFEIVTPTVVFKYVEDETSPGSLIAPYSSIKVEDPNEEKDVVYFDALNTWLAESLQASNPRVPVDLVVVDKEEVCIRYSPLETAQVRGTTKEDIEQFADSLKANLSVLNATTVQRRKFKSTVASYKNLQLVALSSWAGLGAVSYIPQVYVDRLRELTDKEKIDINNLNSELVHKLKAEDTAFSAGQAENGIVCVRFGLITSDTDVEELVSLVHSTGTQVEESSKFLESMSELIRKGIEEANKELEKENADKLMHEGVLRQVPVVSSLLNWFSPTKEQIKGRTFNLTSGKIIPTTDTYKYHMQIQENCSAAPQPVLPREYPQSNGPNTIKGIFRSPSQENQNLIFSKEISKTTEDVETEQAGNVALDPLSVAAATQPPQSLANNVDVSPTPSQMATVTSNAGDASAES